MKTRLILFATLLLLNCFFARGQDGIDTTQLLESYAQVEPEIMAALEAQLQEHGTLTIDRYGRYASPFSQALENTVIQFALENKSKVELNLGYYDLQFNTQEEEEEYYLQRAFQVHYPEQLLDFLELKMHTKAPVSLEMVERIKSNLSVDNITKNFELEKTKQLRLTQRMDVGINKSSLFINGVSLQEISFPEINLVMNGDDCGCSWWPCFQDCTDVDYDVLAFIVSGICGYACKGALSPAGLTGIPQTICTACVAGAIAGILGCAAQCQLDPCTFGHECVPGTRHETVNADCDDGVRQEYTCDCDGQGYTYQDAPCPEGSYCNGNGTCIWPCLQFGTGPNCNNTIILDYNIGHESVPDAQNGYINITPLGGSAPYFIHWDDASTSTARTQLSAGEYCVTVSDIVCCNTTQCFTIKTEACTELEWDAELTVTPACGIVDGSITVSSIEGGVPPYSYVWSNGEGGATINNLEVGHYAVLIFDSNGCSYESSAYVTGIDFEEPIISGTVVHVCPTDLNSGAVYLDVASTSVITDYNWSNGSENHVIEGLTPGTYTVTITDECNNEYTESFEVEGIEVNSSFLPITNGNCDGAIGIDITNGTPPYTYELIGPTPRFEVSDNDVMVFNGLCSGEYVVSVTDQNGCKVEIEHTITECLAPVYGEWYFNESTGQFCRPFTIASSPGCPAESGEFCFTPEYDEWIFNGTKYCRAVICPNGEYCDGFSSSPLAEQCFTPEYGDWYFNEDNEKVCRQVYCNTGAYYCEDWELEECNDQFELENCELVEVNDDDNPFLCKCEYTIDGVATGVHHSDPAEVEYDYDEDENECIRIFFCKEGNDEEELFSEPTEYKDWDEFDVSELKCYREVICFGETDSDWINAEDPERVEWDFDDDNYTCVAQVYCDNSNDYFVEEGDTDVDWDIDVDNGFDCVAEVICDFSGQYEEQLPDHIEGSDYVPTDIQLISGWYQCIFTYSCANGTYEHPFDIGGSFAECIGEVSDGICKYECESSGGEYTENAPCVEAQCGGNFDGPSDDWFGFNVVENGPLSIVPNPFKEQIEIRNLPREMEYVQIDIINVNGVLVKSSKLNFISDLKINTSQLATGVYYINIYNETVDFRHVEKVVKVE